MAGRAGIPVSPVGGDGRPHSNLAELADSVHESFEDATDSRRKAASMVAVVQRRGADAILDSDDC